MSILPIHYHCIVRNSYIAIYTYYSHITQDGTTPLNIARQKGHSDVVKILQRNQANVNVADEVRHYSH